MKQKVRTICKRAALLGLLGVAALALDLFLAKKVFEPERVHPLFVALCLNGLLWAGIVSMIRRDRHIRFERMHLIVLVCSIAVALGFFVWLLKERPFIYFWDYGFYYDKQRWYESLYMGLARGLMVWFATLQEEYTAFLSAFMQLPFHFMGRTARDANLAFAITIIPPLFTCLTALILKIGSMAQAKHPRLLFALAYPAAICMPLAYWSLAHGMPDLFGCVFALMFLILTMDYRFEKIDPVRWSMMFLSVLSLVLTRRWYMFWLVGYVACYAVAWLVWLVVRKRRKQPVGRISRNAFLFVLPSVLLIFVLLRPMILRILSTDYAHYYHFYSNGGLWHEMRSQAGYLGWVVVGLMAAGAMYGTVHGRVYRLTVCTLCTMLLAAALFVSVQSMGWHQSLLLMPCYWTLVIMGCLAVSSAERLFVRRALAAATACAAGMQMLVGFTTLPVPDRASLFSSGNMWSEQRSDEPQVRQVSLWLRETCSNGEKAYFIPHGTPYNPDVFRKVLLPDETVMKILSYGSAVPGTHLFPTELFDAEYVLTCDPFCPYGIAEKYNEGFMHWVDEGKFELIETFDMGSGYTVTAYRRVKPVDLAELESYRKLVEEPNAVYPEHFDQVLDDYIAQHSL